MPEAWGEIRAADERSSHRWLTVAVRALGLTAVAVALAQVFFYFARTVDDLFIALRYAENLAHGRGLLYNPGERVEGMSSPLWVVLQATAMGAGFEGVTATKLLSLASVGCLLGSVFCYARTVLGVSPALCWVALTALGANSYVLAWGLLGLETPLYLALLVAWPLVLHRWIELPSRSRLVAASCVGVSLGCVRPEAPLHVVTLLVAVTLSRPGGLALRERVRRAVRPAAIVGLVLLGLELARRAYFGSWLPHTFHAKRGSGWDWEPLSALVAQGAHPVEVAVVAGGLVAALWLAVRRRDLVPLVAGLTSAVFVGNVLLDWMPNQRHYLPIWVFCALGWVAALDALLRRDWRVRWTGLLGLAVLAGCAVYQVQIDSRFSPKEFATHGRGQHWVREKRPEAWRDAWLALQRKTPEHVTRMNVAAMGMIEQLFRIMEASAVPEAESWYVGRDIGRVGYYSPVRIFDTDGLFTPDVARDAQWRATGQVSVELARRAMERRPVAIEVFETWSPGLGQLDSELGGYGILAGSRRRPVALVLRTARPARDEILRRYARVAAKMPAWFYLATLYGESVGAAFDRRHAHVRQALEAGSQYERVGASPRG